MIEEPPIEQSTKQPLLEILTCKLCHCIFNKPVTLNCGHTFCKLCLSKQIRSKPSQSTSNNENKIKSKNRISVCEVCGDIIWRSLNDMKINFVVQNLIAKYEKDFPKNLLKEDNKADEEELSPFHEPTSSYENKILININEPTIFPMPSCSSDIEFETAFIEDISEQSKCIVVTWRDLLDKRIGLLGSLKKIEPVHKQSTFSRVVVDEAEFNNVLYEKYCASFLGTCFVMLDDVEAVSVNKRQKLIILGKENPEKVFRNLEICNCSIIHSEHTNEIELEEFENFFKHFEQLNNPHLIRQVRSIASIEVLENRSNPELIIYCILRLLKISNTERKDLVLCFDDRKRMEKIQEWLEKHKNSPIDEIMSVKIPGKYNSGVIFFIIFILFAFNLFQNYSKTE